MLTIRALLKIYKYNSKISWFYSFSEILMNVILKSLWSFLRPTTKLLGKKIHILNVLYPTHLQSSHQSLLPWIPPSCSSVWPPLCFALCEEPQLLLTELFFSLNIKQLSCNFICCLLNMPSGPPFTWKSSLFFFLQEKRTKMHFQLAS